MSKDDIMGGEFDWYDLRKESFTHDKPVEVYLCYRCCFMIVLKRLEFSL